jgi:hypothetical protein
MVVFHARHVQLMLRLRLGRLERARQDRDLHVTEFLGSILCISFVQNLVKWILFSLLEDITRFKIIR